MGLFFFSLIIIIFAVTLLIRRLLYRVRIEILGESIYIKETILFSRRYESESIRDIRLVEFTEGGLLPRIKIDNYFYFGSFLSNETQLNIIHIIAKSETCSKRKSKWSQSVNCE